MKKYVVTFSKEITVVVAAPDDMSADDVERAAYNFSTRTDWLDDDAWDVACDPLPVDSQLPAELTHPGLGVQSGSLTVTEDCPWYVEEAS